MSLFRSVNLLNHSPSVNLLSHSPSVSSYDEFVVISYDGFDDIFSSLCQEQQFVHVTSSVASCSGFFNSCFL